MDTMFRNFGLAAFLVLSLMVVSGHCADESSQPTEAPDFITSVSDISTEGSDSGENPLGNLFGGFSNLFGTVSTVLDYVRAVNLSDSSIHPLKSVSSLIREAIRTLEKLAPDLPDLLFHPIHFIGSALPYVLAIALIVISAIPYLTFPTKVLALALSILGLLDKNWTLFDANYLSEL